MAGTKDRPSAVGEKVRRQDKYSLDPYLLEDVTFTLDEIRRAREAA